MKLCYHKQVFKVWNLKVKEEDYQNKATSQSSLFPYLNPPKLLIQKEREREREERVERERERVF